VQTGKLPPEIFKSISKAPKLCKTTSCNHFAPPENKYQLVAALLQQETAAASLAPAAAPNVV